MNAPNTHSSRPARPRGRWLVIPFALLVTGLFLISFACYSLPGFFHIGRDAAALRNSLLKTATRAGEWSKHIEVNVGAVTLELVRAGLALVPMEPDARTALRAVRAAEVSFFQRRHVRTRLDQATMLQDADAAMTSRGWDRVVGVRDGEALVAVYVPKKLSSSRDVRFCVAVVDPETLVVAAGRSNLEPLMEIAERRVEWHHFAQLSPRH